jgi:ABC-type lipoprotein release transport system permease subunit
MMYEISATDLPTLTATSLVLILAALVAILLPSVRSARIDPMICLRQE